MITQIYEVRTPEEAKALVDVGVDYIGVLVGPAIEWKAEISPEQANKVFGAITGNTKKIVLSLSKNLEEIIEIVKKTNPDILHLAAEPKDITPLEIKKLKRELPNIKIMRTIPVEDKECVALAKKYDGLADYLLLDSRRKKDGQLGATGETHDWSLSRKIVESVFIPVILAGGLGPDNVAEAIAKVKPFGVDSKTKTDKDDGSGKDIEKVREFVKIVKATK